MELKDFINKTVYSPTTKKRYFITSITAPEIEAQTLTKNAFGHHTCYSWDTINGDPITNGYLVFEDESLTEPFKEAFEKYSRTEDAYWENYEYWMRRD